jgi:tetratricopeptide (TPR) repeat protein
MAAAHLLAGELARNKLLDPDRALSSYQECLAIEPDNALAFTQVRQLLANAKRWEELSSLLLQRAQVERSRVRLAEIYGALAELALVYLEDRSQAKRYLRMLVQLKPKSVEALKQLADMYFQDEQWQETSHTLLSLAKLEGSHERLKQIFLRLGLIYREKTPDTKRAVASYRKVLALDPANLEALLNLSDLLTTEGQHEQALKVTQMLLERDRDKSRKVSHLLRLAGIHEKGLRDAHSASQAYRKAMELAPLDVDVIKSVAMFYTRQRDQRSLLVHLDRAVTAMRGKQEKAPFAPFAYQSLLKIYGWRKATDRCVFTAQLLETLGHGDEETAKLVKGYAPAGDPERYLADAPHDEPLFTSAVPGGFRLVFQMLSDGLTKLYKGDLRRYKLGRGDRISDSSNAIFRIASQIAKAMKVPGFELYISKEHPRILTVENTTPPTLIIGQALVEGAHENEIRFIMGRCMWVIKKSMILPALLRPEDLEILVAAVVRQYKDGFKPKGADERKLSGLTNQVRKLTKKLRQELMPFAMECSGPSVNPRILGGAVIDAANRAGLLTCRSPQAAVASLAKMGNQTPPGAMGNPQLESLMRYAMTDGHFDLRQSIGISND